MPECDICGEEFDTERGLHIHQSQKHEDGEEETAEEEEDVEEDSGAEEEPEEGDEIVREIEEETSGGLLGGFSRESLVVGGILIGVALGLALGLVLSGSGTNDVSSAEIKSKMEALPGTNLTISSVEKNHGVFEVNVSTTLGNRTVDRTVAYFSSDGEMVYLQGSSYESLRQTLQQRQQQGPQTPPSPPSTNTTG